MKYVIVVQFKVSQRVVITARSFADLVCIGLTIFILWCFPLILHSHVSVKISRRLGVGFCQTKKITNSGCCKFDGQKPKQEKMYQAVWVIEPY